MNIAYTIRWVHPTEEQEPSLCLFKSMSSLCQVTGYAALKKLSLSASAIVKSEVYMVITINMYIEFGSNRLTEAPDTWHSTINDAMLYKLKVQLLCLQKPSSITICEMEHCKYVLWETQTYLIFHKVVTRKFIRNKVFNYMELRRHSTAGDPVLYE